jgi:putative endonuclease
MLVILSGVKNPRISLLLLQLPVLVIRRRTTLRTVMPPDQAYVYILANTFHHLYTGVTTRLRHRVEEHKRSLNPDSHTSRYKIPKLVYYECFESISQAIAREKQIKGWLRIKKIQLIVASNPTWQDLSLDWGNPIEPFDESQLKPPTTF